MSGQWTFGQKLALGFGAVVLLTVVIAGAAVFALRAVSDAKDAALKAAIDDLGDAAELQLATTRRFAGVRGYLLTAEARFVEQARKERDQSEALLQRLATRSADAGVRDLLDRIRRAVDAHANAIDQVIAERGAQGVDVVAIGRRFDAEVTPKADELRAAINAFVAHRGEQVEAQRRAASDTASFAQGLLGGAALISVLLAAGVAFGLGRVLARQVGAAIQHIQSSSAELQAASSQQASAAREQGTAMSEIATTIRELLATSRQIAEGAQRVARVADETQGGARGGEAVVQRTQEAIGEMKRQMDLVVERMLDLGRRSQQIGAVLEVVGELLEQTNILAINATIEAAGAGEGGRRFAAVAEEIRKLSDRVGGSAKEVRSLVDEVRASVHSTVMATETGAKAVDAGSRRFGEVAAAFQQIAGRVGTTTEAAREIELSTKQQTSAVEQVNAAIANVAQAARETEASTAQTLQTASELASLSRELARLVRSDT